MSGLLIRRLRPTDHRGDTLRAGTAGAGRICAALLGLGVELVDVRQAVLDPDAPVADLAGLDLGGPYERVVLGSHLVNVPDEDSRAAFVALAARHLSAGGTLLLEHHPLDWAETAAATSATPGGAPGMVDVRRHPPFVSAVSVFDAGGRVVRRPFTARVLSQAELAGALAVVGLAVHRRLGPTWLEAGRPTIPS